MNHPVRYDASIFAGVLQPVAQAESLPPWCYTEQSVYVREQEQIFRGGWVSVGREDRWRNAGDYVALEVGGTPIIVLRDENGTLRSFANSCRHRGMLLLKLGDGHCERITCPFHGWNVQARSIATMFAGRLTSHSLGDRANHCNLPKVV